jgi:hypothetical protein
MEDNIRNSLVRRELIPGMPQGNSHCPAVGPPLEPLLSTPPSQLRVRTISAMNEHLLAEVNSDNSNNFTNHNINNNSQNSNSNSTTTRSNSNSNYPPTATASLPHQRSSGPPVKGRPPLPVRGRSQSNGHESNGQHELALEYNNLEHNLNLDLLELSPEENEHHEALFQGEIALPEDSLAGEYLLDGPMLDQDLPEEHLQTMDPNKNMNNSGKAPNATVTTTKTTTTKTLAAPIPAGSNHLRRNTGTGGTIFGIVQSTMENPNVNATIRCVSGVYRAHIVQSLEKARHASKHSPVSTVSVSTVHVNLDIFRDDYETSQIKVQAVVPDLSVIEAFYQEFYRRSQMEHDTIIMSLIYVERLIKETNGALAPTLENWRSILFSCMILASKVWDDLSMWNIDFSNVSAATGLSSFSLQRINQLELALLTSLSFSVKVPASEYAKYYFLIRTMLIRSGLLADAALPLNKAEAKMLETRTSEYEATKLNAERAGRRAKSVDWSWLAAPAGPVLKDKICLEQLVAMNR